MSENNLQKKTYTLLDVNRKSYQSEKKGNIGGYKMTQAYNQPELYNWILAQKKIR